MIQSFKDEVTIIKYQLKEQVVLNQLQANEISRISHENFVGLGMLGHLDDFTRLMILVSQHDGSLREKDSVIIYLQSRCRSGETKLVALSASCEPNRPNVTAKFRSDTGRTELSQYDVERDHLSRSLLEATQAVSSRLDWVESHQSHSSTEHAREHSIRQPFSSQSPPPSLEF